MRARGRTALVVDDSEIFRYFAASALEKARVVVLTAADADGALALARAVQPDVVFLDWHLDGDTSEALCIALRRDPRCAACRLVVVSASQDDDVRERCLRAGADRFLEKRAEPEILIAELPALSTD